jgi:hypothetical protein
MAHSSGDIQMIGNRKNRWKTAGAAAILGLMAGLVLGPATVRGEEKKPGLLGP